MNLPTINSDVPLDVYFLSQGIAFIATWFYGSFFEWTLHRNIMHKKTWISYPFELHAMIHHKLFSYDETFHATSDKALAHVTFTPRDYILLLLFNLPVFAGLELLLGAPIMLGATIAVLGYLCAFDLVHWAFHVPKGRFFENFGPYRWLKQHHLLHHRYQNRNLNVVFPLADFVMGTRVSKFKEVEEPVTERA
jgi:hypothetical protein